MQQEAYPVGVTVDYPDRPLDRLATGLRIVVAIPILIVLGTVSGGGSWQWSADNTRAAAGASGLLVLGPLLPIVFRQKYPRWWFDWNLELQRFGTLVGAYLALLDDRYPATDQHQSVHLDYPGWMSPGLTSVARLIVESASGHGTTPPIAVQMVGRSS